MREVLYAFFWELGIWIEWKGMLKDFRQEKRHNWNSIRNISPKATWKIG